MDDFFIYEIVSYVNCYEKRWLTTLYKVPGRSSRVNWLEAMRNLLEFSHEINELL